MFLFLCFILIQFFCTVRFHKTINIIPINFFFKYVTQVTQSECIN